MRHCRPACLIMLPIFAAVAAPATAAPWWYVGHGADRVVFIDAGSIERDKSVVTYSSKTIIRQSGDPVAMTRNFMQADCAGRKLGWYGVQRYGRDEAVIDTSTLPKAKLTDVSADTLDNAELSFVCADPKDRKATGSFPLAIDDASFTDAVLADQSVSPRALHDRMARDPGVAVIRSTAPNPTTFGQVQTVKLGEPLVPPRDYSKGPVIPDPADYPSNEVGKIYDIAYDGIENGRIRFEVRGYSIDDLVHPGTGQIETAYPGEKKVNVRDLAITIKQALPGRITYSVAIEKVAPAAPDCPVGDCSETEVTTKAITAEAPDTPR
ncbi:hypothetical protein G4G27_20460 [Sphingomonas sp. So64.6b]|uniref:surface-adhesin E family protein n=1 Tax=Sphingomonas sp. So64.6b TaxID=2997354 RepID=UPI001604697D|nr:hypothetical protein [Sphingomonas sp. So64.6b]QNA86090.1 hypothetical protein G4G27_20460 [Sphingomonas sp. So64.6b]